MAEPTPQEKPAKETTELKSSFLNGFEAAPPAPAAVTPLITMERGHVWKFEMDEPTDREIRRMQQGFARALRIPETDIEGHLAVSTWRVFWQRLTRHPIPQ